MLDIGLNDIGRMTRHLEREKTPLFPALDSASTNPCQLSRGRGAEQLSRAESNETPA
jgi:hypothetical protein